jgi:uncharacterized membrane protein
MRWAMALFYFVAGIAHIRPPDGFFGHHAGGGSFPREVVLATGGCEIAGAAALITTSLRRGRA